MHKLIFGSGALAILALAPVAHAQSARSLISPTEGHTYFNRPGATLEQEQAAIEECHTSTRALFQPIQSSGAGASYGLVGALTEVAIEADAASYMTRHALFANYENCMVIRGWRVVKLDDATAAELDALDQSALGQRLAPMIGAEVPLGAIARTFHNEMTVQTTTWFGVPPTGPISVPLPFQALSQTSSASIPPEHRRPTGPISMWTPEQVAQRSADHRLAAQEGRARDEINRRAGPLTVGAREARRINPRNIAALPGDSTLLIIRIAGLEFGSGLKLVRVGATDRQPDVVSASIPVPTLFGGHVRDETLVFAVPPGRWRLTAFTGGSGTTTGYLTSFCLGAPAFDIAAGDVVYAGAFAFGSDRPRLDLAIEPGQSALAAAPALAVKLRPASYSNGETFECGGAAYLYAYEIDGAPFAGGYAWGSRANATSPAPAN